MAREQRHYDQNRAIFRGAIHGTRTVEENSEGERFGKVFSAYDKYQYTWNSTRRDHTARRPHSLLSTDAL